MKIETFKTIEEAIQFARDKGVYSLEIKKEFQKYLICRVNDTLIIVDEFELLT